MAQVIKSMNDLKKALESKIQAALKSTQKIIEECIQESIDEYYKEKVFRGGTSNIPLVYERSYKLLNSLVSTDIVKSGDTFSCQVKIDENYLNYQYPGTEGWNGLSATGLDVLTWNSENGSHGGTVDGEWKIWNEAILTLGGENGIISILISKLKKYGIPVKTK